MKTKKLLILLLMALILFSASCGGGKTPDMPSDAGSSLLPTADVTSGPETAGETAAVRDLSAEGMLAFLPEPDEGGQETLKDCGDGCYMMIRQGIPAEQTEACAAAALRSGYDVIAQRREAGNLFYTLYDGAVLVRLIYTVYQSTLRVIAEPCGDVSFLSPGTDDAAHTEKVILVTQIGMDYTGERGKYQSGMSYVCRLYDGSFLVIDGGYYRLTDAVRMYECMKEQSGGGEIVIRAWVLTHAHSDHIGEFIKFAEFYSSLVKVEKIICNFPADGDCAVTGDPERLEECRAAMKKYPGALLIKAHPGDILPVPGAELEILYTTELYYPDVLDQFNLSSMIFRLRAGGKTLLFLGDMLAESGRIIRYVWGEALRSDAVQTAHHGAKGGSTDIYRLISPAYVFWPVGAEDYEAYKELPRNSYLSSSPDIRRLWVARGDIVTVSSEGWEEQK